MIVQNVHHVAIIVSDYEKSKDFYVNKLGFQVIREEYRPVQDDMKLEVQIANCMIEIFGKKNPQPNAATKPTHCGMWPSGSASSMIPTACLWNSTNNMVRPENHKEEAPLAHYGAQFAERDPEEILRRLNTLLWNGEEFYVNLLGREYAISHPEAAFRAVEGGKEPSAAIRIFLLRYLLEGQQVARRGEWKTFREMPWGNVYQVPFSGRILSRAAFTFGTRIDAFRAACEKLDGRPVGKGDGGYEFRVLDNYALQILIWQGDEEFPPSAQILYSDNFAVGFTAEDRVIAAELLIGAIKENI